MSAGTIVLLGTAASVGFLYTVIRPEHYLPFVVLGRARGWSTGRTVLVTLACGAGHMISSVVFGFIGIGLGLAVSRLESVQSARAEIASWVLIGFGAVYMAWGIYHAISGRPDGHRHGTKRKGTTPWALFLIFLLGPCEPLIPLLMVAAATGGTVDISAVAGVFSVVAVGTMVAAVLVLRGGLMRFPLGRVERYAHAIAGLMIFVSGGVMKLLGL